MKYFFLLLLSSFSVISFAQNNWLLALDKDGIQVYTRENPKTNFKDFKAIVTLNARFQDVAPHFHHVEGHTHWIHNEHSFNVTISYTVRKFHAPPEL